MSPPFGFGGDQLGSDIFVPTQIPGCQLWLRADLGFTGSAWADQSGTGDSNKNCIQATGANQPAFNASNSVFNHQSTIDFNGTSDRLVSGTWAAALSQPFTAFAVAVSTDFSGNERIIVDNISGGSEVELFEQSTSKLDFYAGAAVADTTSFNFSNPFIQGTLVNGASSQIFINQKTGQTAANGGTNGMIGTCVGSYGPSAIDFWQGSIAEVIIYNRALAQSDITTVISYCGVRYGIPIGN